MALEFFGDDLKMLRRFNEFLYKSPKIRKIEHFRNLLLPQKEDSVEIKLCKRAFQYISYYYVNVLAESRILKVKGMIEKTKFITLSYKDKILQKILYPETFYYMH